MQIVTQKELQKLTKNLLRLEYKDMKYSVKIRDIQKFEKQIPSALVFLVMKIKKTIKSICQKML